MTFFSNIAGLGDSAGIDPYDVTSFLQERGWAEVYSEGDIWRVWASQDNRVSGSEVVIPILDGHPDFPRLLEEALIKISNIEQLSIGTLVTLMSERSSDVLRISSHNGDTNDGTIALSKGKDIFAEAHHLVVAAASSAHNPRKVFPQYKPAEVTRYLSTVRFGQTEIGSYVVSIKSPVGLARPLQSVLLEIEGEAIIDLPFARKVMTVLMNGVAAVGDYSDQVLSNNDEGINIFADGVDRGISANLCDSLVRIGQTLDISDEISLGMSWAGRLPQRDPLIRNKFTLNREHIPVIQEAAEFLRANEPERGYLLVGKVVRLQRTADSGPGTVTIYRDESPKAVTVVLRSTDYMRAVRAHEIGKNISVTGRLVSTSTSHHIEDPVDMRVLDA